MATMAIFHLTTKPVSRGKGQSVIASAAYRSGERLTDEQTGEIKHYVARQERILFEGVFAPPTAPEWARDRQQLWNHAERFENRKDSRLAREIEMALPHELTDQQREWLVKDFVREQFTRRGYAVDVAIHAPDKDSDERNYHAHLLITTRPLGADDFAVKKDPSQDTKTQLQEWREEWAHLANRHLERHGHAERIDHRSHAERGIEQEPTIHVGYAGMEMDARGAQSDRMGELRGILDRNDGIRMERADTREPLTADPAPDIGADGTEKAPKRDALDLAAGAPMAVIGKIADALGSLFEGGDAPPPLTEQQKRDVSQREQDNAAAANAAEVDSLLKHSERANKEAEEIRAPTSEEKRAELVKRLLEQMRGDQSRGLENDQTWGRERERD
jgi:hypothetical protein